MPVKIRLARRGRRKAPFYHIVVADSRAPRDGRFIEQLGSYNPMTKPATIELDRDRALDWLMKGAQPTYTARAILRFKGVLYKKHLQRGVDKGAITQEQADAKFTEWVNDKEAKIAARFEESQKEMEDFRKMISGEVKKIEKVTAEDADREAFRESGDDAPAEKVEAAESETTAENTEVAAEAETEVVSEEAPVQEIEEAVAEEASKEEE